VLMETKYETSEAAIVSLVLIKNEKNIIQCGL